jgi:hypothetical protein
MSEHISHQHTIHSTCTEGECPLNHETTFEHEHPNGHAHHQHLVGGVDLYAGPVYDIAGTQSSQNDPTEPEPIVAIIPPVAESDDGSRADLWTEEA